MTRRRRRRQRCNRHAFGLLVFLAPTAAAAASPSSWLSAIQRSMVSTNCTANLDSLVEDDDGGDDDMEENDLSVQRRSIADDAASENPQDGEETNKEEYTSVKTAAEFAEMLAMRLFSRESVEAVKMIRSILQNFHNEHGVEDIFHRGFKTHDILFSVYALSRLQSAAIVYEQQQQQQQQQRKESSPAFDNQNPADRQLLRDLAHYVVYANAVYGWRMDLALRLRLHVGGNIQALLRRTGVQPDDVVVAEWESRTHRPAYFVVRDHQKRSIVLAVRGTWSPHDLLTDLCCLPRDFECDSMPNSSNTTTRKLSAVFSKPRTDHRRCGHHGMLEAAKAVHSDVKDTLGREMNEHPGYTLVLVGHSLGGGVAALLSCLLEQQFPDLRAYLYGAPCVAPAASKLHDNIVSVVSEGDPFCRLSLGHVADISRALANLCEEPMLRHDILLRTNQQPKDMAETDLEWCHHAMQTLRSKMTAEKLFPPGRILLLTPATASLLQSRKSADGGDELPSLRQVSMDHFRDLIIGPRMLDLSRHIPSLYEKNLRVLASGSNNDNTTIS